MVDRTRLKEALDWLAMDGLYVIQEKGDRVEINPIIAAARAVVEAPEVLWCEEHRRDASLVPNGEIWCATGVDRADRCAVARVFLVPAEEGHANPHDHPELEKEVWVETEGAWLNKIFYLQPGRYRIFRLPDGTNHAAPAAVVPAEEES
jgi:hypothetical protein